MSGVLPSLILRFGDFELDRGRFELRRNGQSLRLERKPMELLILLASREGQLVTRGEIAERLWSSEVFVDTEHGINTAIRKLRHLLRDDPEEPRFIQTVTGMGYRFIAPITSLEPGSTESRPSTGTSPSDHTSTEEDLGSGVMEGVKRESPSLKRLATWQLLFAATAAILLIFATGFALRSFKNERAATNPGLPHLAVEQRLTANASEVPVEWPAISADGKYLAYGDPTGLYLRQISSGETRRLNLPKDFVAFPPGCWFPDGVHLLVARVPEPSSGLKPSLYKISLLGGEPQEIVSDSWFGSVSPDGSRIAYLSPTHPGELWTVGSDGANARKIVVVSASNKQGDVSDAIWRVVWSPNGQNLAYIQLHNLDAPSPVEPHRSLWIVDPDGTGAKLILDDSRLGSALWWGRNNVLFSYRENSANSQQGDGVYSIRIDGRTRSAAGPPQPVTRAEGVISALSGTADGRRLVVWRTRSPAQAFLSDYDKETRHWSEPRRLIIDANESYAYAWTPDSKAVFFVSDRNGTWKLFKQAIDETSPEVLIERRSLMTPRLSADGTQVLYMSLSNPEDPSSPREVFSKPITGGTPRMVMQAKGIWNYQCAMAPSTLCLYNQIDEDGALSFRAFDLQHGPGRVLFKTSHEVAYDNGNWSLSPDGSKLAIALSHRIRFFSVATGEARDVTVKDWPLAGIDWAANSQTVFMPSRSPAGAPVILEVDQTGKAKVVLQGKPNTTFGWMVQSPDTRHAVLGEYIPTDNNAWIVDDL